MSRATTYRKLKPVLLGILSFAGLSIGAGCQKSDDLLMPSPTDNTILHAVYRSSESFRANPIIMDGQAIDKEWGGQTISYLNVRISGENGAESGTGPAYVSMKAIYTDRDVFFLIRWVDPRPDELKDVTFYLGEDVDSLGSGCQSELVADRNWVRNPGGRFDEDRLAVAFEIDSAGNTIGSFRELGCRAACHLQEKPSFGRLGYGRLDVWQWLSARTNPIRDLYDPTDNPNSPLYGLPGYLDDLLSDSFAGLAPDPGTPSYIPNFREGSDVPLYVYRDRAPDDPYAKPRDPSGCLNLIGEKCRQNNGIDLSYIWRDREEVAIRPFGECDTSYLALAVGTKPRKWRNGDMVAGWMLTYPSGSRADIHGKAGYEDGVWTLEVGRRLNTLDPLHDVIFEPAAGRPYTFTLATMDNSGTEQRGSEPQILVFDPKTAGR